MRIAIIRAGIIDTIVEAPSLADVQASVPDATARLAAVGETATAPILVTKIISSEQCRNLFTYAETVGILMSNDIRVKTFLYKIDSDSDGIDVMSVEFANSMDDLVALGILTPGRKIQIMF